MLYELSTRLRYPEKKRGEKIGATTLPSRSFQQVRSRFFLFFVARYRRAFLIYERQFDASRTAVKIKYCAKSQKGTEGGRKRNRRSVGGVFDRAVNCRLININSFSSSFLRN